MLAKPHNLARVLQSPAKPKASEIGLANNGDIRFQCATCEYIQNGHCQNPNPKLKGRKVEPNWCCNLYDHEGMKVIV